MVFEEFVDKAEDRFADISYAITLAEAYLGKPLLEKLDKIGARNSVITSTYHRARVGFNSDDVYCKNFEECYQREANYVKRMLGLGAKL